MTTLSFAKNATSSKIKQFFTEKTILFPISLGLAIFFSILFAAISRPLTSDVIGFFAPMAQAFIDSDWEHAFFPNDSILQSFLGGLLGRGIGISGYAAVVFLSCFFYSLTVFPLYSIYRHFFSEKWSALGCLLYVIAPVVIKNSCNGTLDPGKVFFTAWSIAILFNIKNRNNLSDYIYLGFSTACLTLIRGEGIILVALIYGWAILFPIAQKLSHKAMLTTLKNLLLSGIIFIMLIAPRAWQGYKVTGYPVVDCRQSASLQKIFNVLLKKFNNRTAAQNSSSSQQALQDSSLDLSTLSSTDISSKPWDTPYAAPEYFADRNYIHHFTFTELFRDFRRGSYEIYLLLAILGLNLFFIEKKQRLSLLMMLSLSAANAFCFSIICLAHRYFIINIVVFMPFTLQGIKNICQMVRKHYPNQADKILLTGVLLCLLIMVIDIGRRFHKNFNSPYRKAAAQIQKQYPDLNRSNAVCLSEDYRLAFCLDLITYPLSTLEKREYLQLGKKYHIASLNIKNKIQPPEFLKQEKFQEKPELSSSRCRIFIRQLP